MENLAEGGDLVAGDHAVGLGHFGAQGDHADGEGDFAGPAFIVAVNLAGSVTVDGVAGDRAQKRAERSAKRETGRPANDFAPNAHPRILNIRLCRGHDLAWRGLTMIRRVAQTRFRPGCANCGSEDACSGPGGGVG